MGIMRFNAARGAGFGVSRIQLPEDPNHVNEPRIIIEPTFTVFVDVRGIKQKHVASSQNNARYQLEVTLGLEYSPACECWTNRDGTITGHYERNEL